MSRSGYGDCDSGDNYWGYICWRGQVESAIRGKRGQAFFRDLVAALDAIPGKRLIQGSLNKDGEVCAIGAACSKRGIDPTPFKAKEDDDYSTDNHEALAAQLGIAHQLVQEVEHENDADWRETPEDRWKRIREWAGSKIKPAEVQP